MKKIKGVLSLLFLLIVQSSFAQLSINGRVTDSENIPLSGVAIVVKGANIGTTTNERGEYAIKTQKENSTIVFSFIGYDTKEVNVGKNPVINISLVKNSNLLNEVVVTAFGIEKSKRNLGYSTQSMDGREILKAREPNAMNALTGKIAGLTIGNSPELLAAPNVMLRGNFGILFVVDGIPINTDTWNISADDIDTYTVLKGPNASVLYGFRGQNGAILLQQKKALVKIKA
jgi:hypothetical protein